MSYNEKIKTGSVVRLKSGAMLMTVESEYFDKRHNIACVWFLDDGNIAKYTFDAIMLEVLPEVEVQDAKQGE